MIFSTASTPVQTEREERREGERAGVGVAGSRFCFQGCPRSRFVLRNWVYFLAFGLMLPTASGSTEMSSLSKVNSGGGGHFMARVGLPCPSQRLLCVGAKHTGPDSQVPGAPSQQLLHAY